MLPLLSLLLTLWILGDLFPAPLLCGVVDYYVTPTDSSHPDCPTGEPCYTIDHYASNHSYFSDMENITMNFLSGTHNLTQDLIIYNLHSLTFRSFNTNHGFSTLLLDFPHSTITLQAITETMLEGLKINGSSIGITFQTARIKLVLQDVTFVNTAIFLVQIHSAQGSILLRDSVFLSSILVCHVNDIHGPSSNLNMIFRDLVFYSSSDLTQMSLTLKKVNFTLLIIDNITTIDPRSAYNGGPLSYNVKYDSHSDLYIHLEGDKTHQSTACINITNSEFSRSHSTGVYIDKPDRSDVDVHITNTIISNHKYGAVMLNLGSIYCPCHIHLTIVDSHILNNSLTNVDKNRGKPFLRRPGASGVTIYGDVTLSGHETTRQNEDFSVQVVIRNTIFKDNHDFRGHSESSVVWLFRFTNVAFIDCGFQGNEGTPIVAYYSDFTLSGNVSFRGNTATKGGAISLTSSHMYITKNTSVVFEDNSATDVGGAIFVEQPNVYLDNDPTTTSQCFYQLPDWEEKGDYYLGFYNNTAKHGGEQLYGVSLKSYCTVYTASNVLEYTHSYQVDDIFHFEPDISDADSVSSVSSDPTRICLCEPNGQYQCDNVSHIFQKVSAHPGELFTLSAIVVGSHFGSTTGTVYAQFLPHSQTSGCTRLGSLKSSQYSQGVRNFNECTQIQYSVYSACYHEVIILTATGSTVGQYGDKNAVEEDIYWYQVQEDKVIPPSLLTTPVYINVTLLPCPLGFILTGNLTGDPPGCECYPIFGENRISCDVTSGRVTRSGTQFVTALFEGNESTEVIVHNHCPFGYCKPVQVAVDLNTPDSQCAFNRSGILCGACKEGYSSALGSSRCLQCENRYLALLLFFAVAGILLVLFIKVLNLTVAQGTINGLIFYANVVWANQSILYPDQEHANGASVFFKTFIAWLNLDFGIETCFVQGLNGYWKTWLQFVFPFYIWAIAGVIILVSRHSSLMTKLFGNNAVPVLATLFLLSYSKLLRTIITAMSMTFLVEYPDGQKSTVWSFDGNIQFCGMPHVFLFIAALAALLILWLPYTSVLLSVQWLQKGSEYKVLRWVDKLKPILDAYFAPFKDKHHYWVGVLLLVRGVLLITVALTEANMPTANLLALVTVAATLLAYTALTGNLYKKTYVVLLDTLSLLNLVILGGGTLYIDNHGGNGAALAFTSIGIAFLQFTGIVLFHVIQIFQGFRKENGAETDRQDPYQDDESLFEVASHVRYTRENNTSITDQQSTLHETLLDETVQQILSGAYTG